MDAGRQLLLLLVELAVDVAPLQVHGDRAGVGAEAEVDLEAAEAAMAAAAVELGDLLVPFGVVTVTVAL